MSFTRTVAVVAERQSAGHEAVPAYLKRVGWTEAQYGAARALGFPEPIEFLQRNGGVMLPTFHVRAEAAADWQRDFARLCQRDEHVGLPLTLSAPYVSNLVPLTAVLTAMRWTMAEHTMARSLFGFPTDWQASLTDDHSDTVRVVRRHEVDQWLQRVRVLAPGFATVAGQ